MADEPEGTETEHPDGGPAAAGLSDSELEKLAAMVAGKIGPAHAASTEVVQDRLSAPGDVAAIVRAELARTDREARDAEVASKVESHSEIIAKLTEAPPVAPVRWIERRMKWAG